MSSWILWLWIFLAVARIWYLVARGEPLVEGGWIVGGLWPLALGVVRDGVVIGLMWMVAGLAAPRLGGGVRTSVRVLIPVLAAAYVAVMMAGADFFLYFGHHATLQHLGFLRELGKIQSSVSHVAGPGRTLLTFAVVPLGYLVAGTLLPFRGLAAWTWQRRVGVGAAVTTAGLAVGGVLPADPLTASFVENHVVFVARHLQRPPVSLRPDAEAVVRTLRAAPLAARGGADPGWSFVDPELPLIKATPHHLCRLGRLDEAACAIDSDGDGYVLGEDCNDHDPGVHPAAADLPRNGVDEDCSGLDADPPNVIFIHWEGVRAVNVGSIGYHTPATPRFDRFARDGLLFRNAYTNGIQTRWSLISVYGSILPRLSSRWIFRHNPQLEMLSLPAVLRSRGYETLYVHGGFIDFAGKGDRLAEWFETRYDLTVAPMNRMPVVTWGLADRDVFRVARAVLHHRKDPRPFFMTVATLSLHHPFLLPEAGFALAPHDDPRNQMANLIHYCDDALGEFLQDVLSDPALENTIVVVAADHGINWFAPHPQREQNVLWEDLVWVPLALLGDGWGERGVVDEVRQLADVAPTVLDRLGVEVPNPYIGHSLLRRFSEGGGRAFFGTATGGKSAGIRDGPYKYFVDFASGRGHLFDLEHDRQEHHDLADSPQQAARVDELDRTVRAAYAQGEWLVRENRVWSWDYWIGEMPPGARRRSASRP